MIVSKTIGTFDVSVELSVPENEEDSMIFLKATCGDVTVQRTICPHHQHDHSDEQYERDIQDAAELAARECAGKARALQLRRKIFGGQPKNDDKTL